VSGHWEEVHVSIMIVLVEFVEVNEDLKNQQSQSQRLKSASQAAESMKNAKAMCNQIIIWRAT
jgi:hypothetical protein